MRRVTTFSAGLLVLAGALAVLFHRVLLGEVLYWGLPSLQFVPWRTLAMEQLARGVLPLWNPYSGAGAPLFANYQSALLYPPGWITLLLGAGWGLSVLTVAHLLLAGAGMAAFTRRLGAAPLGAGVAGLAFGMCGYLVARAGTYPMVSAAAWLPWLLWAALGWMRTGDRRMLPALAACWALALLAGHAQTAWYSGLLLGALLLALAAWQRAFRRLLLALAALALGTLIPALQLAATGELLLASQRSGGVSEVFAMNFSLSPLRLLTLFAPNVFGTPADGSFLTGGAYFEDAAYIGLLPLVAALSALAGLRGRWRVGDALARPALLFALLALIGLALALGVNTPLFPLLYRYVPVFDLFQAPVRWLLWTITGGCVLAAVGVTWWSQSARARRWTRRLMAACAAAVLAGMAAGLAAGMPESARVIGKAAVLAGVIGLAAGWLSLTRPPEHAPGSARWSWLVLLLVAVDLVIAHWGLNPTAPAGFYAPRPATADRAYWPEDALKAVQFGRYFSFDDYRLAGADLEGLRGSGLPNIGVLDHQALLNNFDPLLPEAFDSAMRRLARADAPAQARLLRAAGVDVLMTEVAPQALASAPDAWIVRAACWHADDAALDVVLLSADFAPERRVELAGAGPCDSAPDSPAAADVTAPDSDGGRYLVRSAGGGWLVLAQSLYPGWQAEVNGQPAPIERANGMFMAVRVPAGESEVRLMYRPSWAVPGVVLSTAGLLAWLMLTLWTCRRPAYNTKDMWG
jgi:hypothetical protein